MRRLIRIAWDVFRSTLLMIGAFTLTRFLVEVVSAQDAAQRIAQLLWGL